MTKPFDIQGLINLINHGPRPEVSVRRSIVSNHHFLIEVVRGAGKSRSVRTIRIGAVGNELTIEDVTIGDKQQ